MSTIFLLFSGFYLKRSSKQLPHQNI